MTKLLEQALDRVRTLPPAGQDEMARILLRLVGEEGSVYALAPEEHADLDAAEEEVVRGELVGEEDVLRALSKFSR